MFNQKHRRLSPDLIFHSNAIYQPAPLRRRALGYHPAVLALIFVAALGVLYFGARPAVGLFAAFAETVTGR